MGRTIALIAVLALAGLGAVVFALTGAGAQAGGESSDRDAGAPAARSGGVPIEIRQRGRIGFIEGGFTFLQVKRPRGQNGPSSYGRPVDAQFFGSEFDAAYTLPRGSRFKIVSYQRACGGFCSPRSLDPPSHGCSATVSTRGVESLRARIETRAGKRHCRIAVGGAESSG